MINRTKNRFFFLKKLLNQLVYITKLNRNFRFGLFNSLQNKYRISCGPNLAKSCNNKHSLIVVLLFVELFGETRSICVTFYFALKESPHTFSAFITFLDETHNLLLSYKLKPKKHLSCSLTLLWRWLH